MHVQIFHNGDTPVIVRPGPETPGLRLLLVRTTSPDLVVNLWFIIRYVTRKGDSPLPNGNLNVQHYNQQLKVYIRLLRKQPCQ